MMNIAFRSCSIFQIGYLGNCLEPKTDDFCCFKKLFHVLQNFFSSGNFSYISLIQIFHFDICTMKNSKHFVPLSSSYCNCSIRFSKTTYPSHFDSMCGFMYDFISRFLLCRKTFSNSNY